NADVASRVRALELAAAEVALADRRDERPVVADRAALDACHAEVDGLELDAGDPDRREQMPLATADDRVEAELVADRAARERERGDPAGRQRELVERAVMGLRRGSGFRCHITNVLSLSPGRGWGDLLHRDARVRLGDREAARRDPARVDRGGRRGDA